MVQRRVRLTSLVAGDGEQVGKFEFGDLEDDEEVEALAPTQTIAVSDMIDARLIT